MYSPLIVSSFMAVTEIQMALALLAVISVVVLFLIFYFRWRDFLLLYRISQTGDTPVSQELVKADNQLPKLSVILPINDQTDLLRKHLPVLLQQNYPNFEIIVVDEAPTKETKDFLEQLKFRHRNLRSTFIPDTATDICTRKLAVTLGVRAARSEWVVVTNVTASPVSSNWLSTIAGQLDEQCDIVLGYANFVNGNQDWQQRAIYERLMIQLRCVQAARGYGAIGGDEANFCIRKQRFLEHNGYSELLDIPFGESHLLIESMASPENVRIAFQPESWVRDAFPVQEIWQNSRIFYREILHHSTQRTRFYLWREGFASLMLYLYLLIAACYLEMRVLLGMNSSMDCTWTDWLVDAVMLVSLCAYFFIPIVLYRKMAESLGERNLGWNLIRYQLAQPWVNLRLKFLRWRQRKNFC